jgi:hypothetical protein
MLPISLPFPGILSGIPVLSRFLARPQLLTRR